MNSCKQLFYLELVVAATIIIMVLAVFVGMYASVGPSEWSAEIIFCSHFFGISVPAWLGALWLAGRIRKTFPAPAESLVTLPGLGPSIVRWEVRDCAHGRVPQRVCLNRPG